ncbi:hypothetical protein INT46_009157 [Mucor plumbeus]|uniref:RING-type domain-containing protein n=1 Tax=Mucor plumbeus TaxID=97098 RepID=A0A8H7RDQ9_9FUNG|nr:hypothetical protein INT46_009157 [Mucor plumbeus]
MGHACSKVANTTALTVSVDHGSLTPQGIYTTDNDYDINIIRQLIRKGQLAPFYTGLNEPSSNYKKLAYETECPICFLYYPSKMNRTRCCDKSICTECFLQLRRSSSSPLVPAVCPFCVQPNLGVLYIPPDWSKHYLAFKKRRTDLFSGVEEKDRRRNWRLEPDDPDVVLVDTVRPRWEEMLEERRFSAVGTTRRRRVQLNNDERSRRPTRRASSSYNLERYSSHDSAHTIYDTFANVDLEDILVMEAIRLSLVTANNSMANEEDDDDDNPINTTTTNTTATTISDITTSNNNN